MLKFWLFAYLYLKLSSELTVQGWIPHLFHLSSRPRPKSTALESCFCSFMDHHVCWSFTRLSQIGQSLSPSPAQHQAPRVCPPSKTPADQPIPADQVPPVPPQKIIFEIFLNPNLFMPQRYYPFFLVHRINLEFGKMGKSETLSEKISCLSKSQRGKYTQQKGADSPLSLQHPWALFSSDS